MKYDTKGPFFSPFQQSKWLIYHLFMQPQLESQSNVTIKKKTSEEFKSLARDYNIWNKMQGN